MQYALVLVLATAASAAVLPSVVAPEVTNQTVFQTKHDNTPGVCNLEDLQSMLTGSLADWTKKFQSVGRAPCYNWCTDGCTGVPDYWQNSRTIFSPGAKPKIDLRPACARHDFAYRNLKRYKAFNEENKLKADELLRSGIIELCAGDEGCTTAATDVYFRGVRPVDTPAAGRPN